jgi:hypothetical protein
MHIQHYEQIGEVGCRFENEQGWLSGTETFKLVSTLQAL